MKKKDICLQLSHLEALTLKCDYEKILSQLQFCVPERKRRHRNVLKRLTKAIFNMKKIRE